MEISTTCNLNEAGWLTLTKMIELWFSPLIEVPVMIELVNVAFFFQKKYYGGTVGSSHEMLAAAQEVCPPLLILLS